MRVLHINTTDIGGAATACRRIHTELLRKGIDSKVLLLRKSDNVPQTFSFGPVNKRTIVSRISSKIKSKIAKDKEAELVQKYSKDIEVFTFPNSLYDVTRHTLYREADIIQLNWVSGFLDEPSFFKKNTKPVIWRMADLYACGSGYHYEANFPFAELNAILKRNYKIREASLKNANITLVPISEWVKKKAEQSTLIRKFNKTVIHNGLDLNVFKPLNRTFAKSVFNLPTDKKIILFGADHTNIRRKGFHLLKKALPSLDLTNICICVFGKSVESFDQHVVNIGPVKDERLLSILYSAADLFIMPSVEEAFGQVTIESIACGTPVVSFPNGGSLDIIISELNGILADDFTGEALGAAIHRALEISFDREKIRKDAEKRFNISEKVNEYIDLYKNMCGL